MTVEVVKAIGEYIVEPLCALAFVWMIWYFIFRD
jgi:hypothetical protein